MPIYQNLLVEEIGIDRRIHTPILRTVAYFTNLSRTIGPSNRYRSTNSLPIEGVNRYRYAISQPIDMPIGIFNRLLSRVCCRTASRRHQTSRTDSLIQEPTPMSNELAMSRLRTRDRIISSCVGLPPTSLNVCTLNSKRYIYVLLQSVCSSH